MDAVALSAAMCPACFMEFHGVSCHVKALSSRSFATRFCIRKSVGEVATASTRGRRVGVVAWRLGVLVFQLVSTRFNYSLRLCSLCASGLYCRHLLVSLCRVCQARRNPKQFLPNRCCFLSGSSS